MLIYLVAWLTQKVKMRGRLWCCGKLHNCEVTKVWIRMKAFGLDLKCGLAWFGMSAMEDRRVKNEEVFTQSGEEKCGNFHRIKNKWWIEKWRTAATN